MEWIFCFFICLIIKYSNIYEKTKNSLLFFSLSHCVLNKFTASLSLFSLSSFPIDFSYFRFSFFCLYNFHITYMITIYMLGFWFPHFWRIKEPRFKGNLYFLIFVSVFNPQFYDLEIIHNLLSLLHSVNFLRS